MTSRSSFSMRVHCFQHVPFEGPGSIADWLGSINADVGVTRFFESPVFPEVNDIDLLIVMGGPMSVNDESVFPWLIPEKAFIHSAIAANKAVIGICLGAQLIANALGAAVYANTEKEIGWFPINGIDPGGNDSFLFPDELRVFHWHGETFDLPDGAMCLASSDACQNQAFQLGERVIGLQFHLEMTPQSVRDIVHHCRAEIIASRYVQSAPEILAAEGVAYQNINNHMNELLEFVIKT